MHCVVGRLSPGLVVFLPPKTRQALGSILSDLHQEDYFGIVIFDSEINPWKESLTSATADNVAEARNYVRSISSRGGWIPFC